MAKQKLTNISDKAQYTEAYHNTQSAVEAFGRIAPNIPKSLLHVVQNIYGRFDTAAFELYNAGNTFDKEEKLKSLSHARASLFYQMSSIELIVKARGISIGAANTVLSQVKLAYEGTNKWFNSVRK